MSAPIGYFRDESGKVHPIVPGQRDGHMATVNGKPIATSTEQLHHVTEQAHHQSEPAASAPPAPAVKHPHQAAREARQSDVGAVANTFVGSITPAQRSAVELYQSGESKGYVLINDQLRTGHKNNNATIRGLDAAIAGSKATEAATVFRGCKVFGPFTSVGSAKKAVGHTFVDLGYVSTTTDPVLARAFENDRNAIDDRGRVLFDVAVPKGSSALHVPAMPEDQGYSDENEILLPRGTTFKIDSVRSGSNGLHVKLSVVAQHSRSGV